MSSNAHQSGLERDHVRDFTFPYSNPITTTTTTTATTTTTPPAEDTDQIQLKTFFNAYVSGDMTTMKSLLHNLQLIESFLHYRTTFIGELDNEVTMNIPILRAAALTNSPTIIDSVIQLCNIDIQNVINYEQTSKPSPLAPSSTLQYTILQQVIHEGLFESSKHLIEKHNYNINTCTITDQQVTALSLACQSNNNELIKYIFQSISTMEQIQLYQIQTNLSSCLNPLILHNNFEMVQYFIQNTPEFVNNVDFLNSVVTINNTQMLDYFIKLDSTQPDQDVHTPMNLLIKCCNWDCLFHLINTKQITIKQLPLEKLLQSATSDPTTTPLLFDQLYKLFQQQRINLQPYFQSIIQCHNFPLFQHFIQHYRIIPTIVPTSTTTNFNLFHHMFHPNVKHTTNREHTNALIKHIHSMGIDINTRVEQNQTLIDLAINSSAHYETIILLIELGFNLDFEIILSLINKYHEPKLMHKISKPLCDLKLSLGSFRSIHPSTHDLQSIFITQPTPIDQRNVDQALITVPAQLELPQQQRQQPQQQQQLMLQRQQRRQRMLQQQQVLLQQQHQQIILQQLEQQQQQPLQLQPHRFMLQPLNDFPRLHRTDSKLLPCMNNVLLKAISVGNIAAINMLIEQNHITINHLAQNQLSTLQAAIISKNIDSIHYILSSLHSHAQLNIATIIELYTALISSSLPSSICSIKLFKIITLYCPKLLNQYPSVLFSNIMKQYLINPTPEKTTNIIELYEYLVQDCHLNINPLDQDNKTTALELLTFKLRSSSLSSFHYQHVLFRTLIYRYRIPMNFNGIKARTVFHELARIGELDLLQMVLKYGQNTNNNLDFLLNKRDEDKMTPLLHSIQNHHPHITRCLIQHNAHYNIETVSYQPLFHFAMLFDANTELVSYFVQLDGFNIEARDQSTYNTPLLTAATVPSWLNIQTLLQFHANPYASNHKQYTFLHLIAFKPPKPELPHNPLIPVPFQQRRDQPTFPRDDDWDDHAMIQFEKVIELIIDIFNQ